MLGASGYKTKKDLKASIGKSLCYIETSLFGDEYKSTGKFCMVGPDAYRSRKWFAEITMENDIIIKVA
jgi:hypothetical protein